MGGLGGERYLPTTKMENFIKIITQPDNIAIVVMLIVITICTIHSFREMWLNDKLIKDGKKDEVYKRMIRP